MSRNIIAKVTYIGDIPEQNSIIELQFLKKAYDLIDKFDYECKNLNTKSLW